MTMKKNAPKQEPSKKRALERAAFVFCVCVVAGSLWYWQSQVRSVVEMLEMAYG